LEFAKSTGRRKIDSCAFLCKNTGVKVACHELTMGCERSTSFVILRIFVFIMILKRGKKVDLNCGLRASNNSSSFLFIEGEFFDIICICF